MPYDRELFQIPNNHVSLSDNLGDLCGYRFFELLGDELLRNDIDVIGIFDPTQGFDDFGAGESEPEP